MTVETHGLHVAGRSVEPRSGAYVASVDPATGAEIARVAVAGPDDVDPAVRAAAGAAWATMPGAERAKHLYRLAELVAERSRELAALETRDQGKPLREAAELDLPYVAATLFSHAGWADKLGYACPGAGLGPGPRPVGVVGALLGWAYPLVSLAAAAAPALACGNPVVLKPAASTSLTALAFARLCAEAGLPPGTVNVVTGGADTGRALAAHPGVGVVTYAGSSDGGRDVARALAGTGRGLSIDAGGHAVNIVFDDAPLASAVDGIVDGFLGNAGQGGWAGARLLVQESVHDEVVAAVTGRVASLRLGDPGDRYTDLGPLHSPERVAAVAALCRAADDEGARRWSPDWQLPARGSWHLPAVYTGVAPSRPLARDEVGGPVLAVLTFRTAAEAVALATNTPYGRAAGVWTDKGSRAAWLAGRLRVGTVWLNCFQRFDPAAPAGGHREAGLGVRGGRAGLATFLRGTVA